MKQKFVTVLALLAFAAHASPPVCHGISRNLTDARKATLEPEIARQLHVPKVDVLKSFKLGTWSIIYVDTHQSDNAFLFFALDPLSSHYITLWGGAAMRNEQPKIRAWANKNAPGIPDKLAGCFAWYVTKSLNP